MLLHRAEKWNKRRKNATALLVTTAQCNTKNWESKKKRENTKLDFSQENQAKPSWQKNQALEAGEQSDELEKSHSRRNSCSIIIQHEYLV